MPIVCFFNGLWLCMVQSILNSSALFPNYQGVTRHWQHSISFSWKYNTFGTIAKIIWFWSTIHKKTSVNFDVSKICRVSKFVKPWQNRKIKVISFYSANYCNAFCLFYQKYLSSLRFENNFPTEWYFSTLDLKNIYL